MRTILCGFGLTAILAAAPAADPAVLERGRAEEKRCVGCHSLTIIGTQRLGRAGWDRELTKMAGWGSEMKDRPALLEYLVATYGADKPMAKPAISSDATAAK